MDQVYEILLSNQGEEKNYIEMGQQNPYDTIVGFTKYSVDVCVGQVTSNGWKHLENYPNDFRVGIINMNYESIAIISIKVEKKFLFLVRFDYLRLLSGWMSHSICEQI